MPTPSASETPAPFVLPPAGWPRLEFPRPDPLLDRPNAAQPGPFANVETSVEWLHLRNQLGGPVLNPFTGNADVVKFPGNRLDAAISPRVELGYRLPDGWGALSVGYRYLGSRGHDEVTTGPEDEFQGTADQVGRLDYSILDFEYSSREFSLGPVCNMRWGVGARMMFLFFDSRIRFLDPGADPGSVLTQSESSFTTAWGGFAFLDLERQIGDSGLAVFGRVEFTDFFARSRQNYAETVAGNPGGPSQLLQTTVSGSVGVSVARGVAGLSYTVPRWNYSRFMIGYEYETFFQIGRLTPISGIVDTRGQLDAQGLFLRGEVNF
jgi:hypothetical protein